MRQLLRSRIFMAIVTLALSACGGGSDDAATVGATAPTQTGPSPVPSGPVTSSCSATVAGNPGSVSGSGGRFTLSLTTGSTCAWTAQSDAAWAMVTPGSGMGSASPTLVVEENTDASNTRSANITIASQVLHVSQASGCIYTVDMSTAEVGYDSGNFNVNVSARDGCAWTASATESWLHLNPTRGSGNDAVHVSVDENRGGTRHATLTIAGKRITVNQAARP